MISTKYAYLLGEKYSYNLNWVLGTFVQGILLVVAGILSDSWILISIVYFIFYLFDGLWQPAWNHVLVEQTKGKAIATTRSIIFAIFALYITIGKQLLAFLTPHVALIGLGIFIIGVNLFMGRKILALQK